LAASAVTDIILVATGSAPHHPPNIPFDEKYIYDSIDSEHDRIPNTMVIVGGSVDREQYARCLRRSARR
jgi:pyruvate/2-oxoglutarate dehydrogenase complex dihydrolipoamide dehydrogenase (E3) component